MSIFDKVYGVICRTGDNDEITEFSYWFTKERAEVYAAQENSKQDDRFHQYHVIEMAALPVTKSFLENIGAKQI